MVRIKVEKKYKNNIMRKIVMTIIGTFMLIQLQAQNAVRLLDLSVMPLIKVNEVSTDSVELMINFKISDPATAAKVYFMLGAVNDDSSLLVVTPLFIHNANGHFLSFSHKIEKIENHAVVFYLTITKTLYHNFSAATLFVETNNGVPTNHLYFNK